ncbi:hypothetical protein Micbo1qcDRAFT_194570 [Microdochium bolleyi]|uniref:LPXTG-domain-containing protein n=1 Tax=Microdochium bolleyi TaxID=196109 RepID=A0A136J862_9PEZI|nr:hypothetical protein Micbo1qcDRAFT_194570 [Microdochium bolleyi]
MARVSYSIFVLLCLLALSRCTRALQVTPGSACAAFCLDNTEDDPNDPSRSTTTPKDVVCTDSKYSTQAAGIKYQNCLQCLQNSHVAKGSESDAAWYLYNLRYTLNVCMYSYPNVTKDQMVSTPCNTEYACEPFKNALRVGIPNAGSTESLDYCRADGDVFTDSRLKGCVKCLQSSGDQTYLANFMIALKGACDYRPNAQTLLGLSGSIFQSTAIEVIDPARNAPLSEGNTTQGMTTGAIVGIAVGAALLFLGGIALFWVYHRKQKRMYSLGTTSISYPRMRDHGMMPPFMGGGGGGRGMVSLHSKNGSVASNYDIRMIPAPVFSHTEARVQPIGHTNYNFDPHQAAQGPNAALPTHPAYIPHTMSRAGLTRSPSPPQPVLERQPQQPQQQAKPRTLSSLSINPQMSAAAHARVQAYVMSESNSHPLTQQQRQHEPMPPLPQIPAAIVPAGSERGPSPAFSGYSSSSAPRGPSPNDAPTARLLPGGVPPPPPPAASRAVKLSMPVLPKLRTAKQYTPPQIVMVSSQDENGGGSFSPDSGPGEFSSNVTIGLDIGNPLPQHRQRWANESMAGVSMPGQQQQQQQQQEHQYSSASWRGQGVARNFSNPYSRARLPDRGRRETHFEDIETPNSGMSERIYG